MPKGVFDRPSPMIRLLRSIRIDENGCWLWTLTTDKGGYTRVRVGNKLVATHRFTYERLIGPIPVGLDLDHLCRVRHCCNPTHVEPVTRRENVLRGLAPTVSLEAARI